MSAREFVVTREMIEEAVPHSSKKCMIAEAVKAAQPRVTNVTVDLQAIRWTGRRGVRYTYLTPPAVQEKLIAFDQGETDKLTPFTFYLGYPTHKTKPRAEGDQSKLPTPADDETKPVVEEHYRKHGKTGNVVLAGHPTFTGGKAPPPATLRRRKFGIRTAKP
jgi:hypothetical protein